MRRLGEVRRSLVALRGGTESELLDVGNDFVLAWRRRSPRGGAFVGLANFSPYMQGVDADAATGFGTYQRVLASDEAFEVKYSRLVVPGLGFAWYAEP